MFLFNRIVTGLLIRLPGLETGLLRMLKHAWICGLPQYVSFYGTAVAYVVTTLTYMRAILKANCYHKEGRDGDCKYGGNTYMLLFGVLHILMSQILDFHSMVLVSVVAAIMSFCYFSIGLGLGFAQVIENGKIAGSITGYPAVSVAHKLWLTFQALGDIAFAFFLGDIAFAYPHASAIVILATSFFYLGCGCLGYAAFENDTPGNLLTGFGFYEPYWHVAFANACIIMHLI
ncbi:putative amino acid transporter, transmembrane domain-containing protein [Helianthus anomalus]